MERDTIYMWPTQLWCVVGPILLCSWIAAINYSNNLIYFLLYLILSLSFLSIFQTWSNLLSIKIEQVRVSSGFAPHPVQVDVSLRNLGSRAAVALQIIPLESRNWWREWLFRCQPLEVTSDVYSSLQMVPPQGGGLFSGTLPPKSRGRHTFYMIEVRSQYPFGLFWAIRRRKVDAFYYVYPQPLGSRELPKSVPLEGEEVGNALAPGDDYYGVRPYLAGESLRLIDWKGFARGRGLTVKQFLGGAQVACLFDLREIPGLDVEAKLSQVTQWVLEAEKNHTAFALRLHRDQLQFGTGPAHLEAALRLLAEASALA